ncbi:MAG: NAD(P)/FAD-dependent oxidoreductase [Actinomycetota bacterium]|nr:NAD(P)/FAD-dependent oxidoreductase [Actinomycetota bacterium]
MPSKSLLASAAAFRMLKRSSDFGLTADSIGFDFSKIIDRKDRIVSKVSGPGMRQALEKQGIRILDGAARFISPNEVSIDGKNVTFEKAVIATGSAPFVPPIEGLNEVDFMTSDDAINLRELPPSIIIVGGSAVGLEFATIYSSFGSEVTIVEATPRIAFKEDAETALALTRYLAERGVAVYTNVKTKRVFSEGSEKSMVIDTADGEVRLSASKLLIATGRHAVTTDLGLEDAGIEVGKKGIEVNEYLQTSVSHIYAAGDVVPFIQLAQAAAYEGDLAGYNAFATERKKLDLRVMPRVTWSYPEIASVGITEEEAKENNLAYVVQKFPFAGLGRALADDEREGFVKFIADTNTEEVLGCHIIGHHADEMIHQAAQAMQLRAPITELAQTISCELTMSEGIGNALIDLGEQLGEQHEKRKTA